MLRSRTRKIWSDVFARKGRTAMAAIAIFIGVLGVVTLVSTSDIIMQYLSQAYQPDVIPMLSASVTMPSGIEIDNQATLDMLKAQPGVTDAEGRISSPITFKLPDETSFDDGMIEATGEAFGQPDVYPVRDLSEGRFPTEGQHEVAIDARMAQRYMLKVGDTLTLRMLGDAEIHEEAWTVVGIVPNPYFTGSPGTVYANHADAQRIAGVTGFTNLYVNFTDFETAKANTPALLDTLAAETPYLVQFQQLDNPEDSMIIRNNATLLTILNVLALVALAVCGFLVTNIINAIIVEQKRQIGVMKAIGASPLDNIFIYAGIAFTYGLLGTIPGVLVGIFTGYTMAAAIGNMSFLKIDFQISTAGVLTGVGMGLLVPLFAALIPVFNGTRVRILDAMTDLGIASNYGKGLLARIIARLPLPVNVRQALSNVSRKKGRLVLTGITLTLAVASFMGVLALTASLNQLVDDIYGALKYQVQIQPREAHTLTEMRTLLSAVDAVDNVYPYIVIGVQMDGYVNPFDQSSTVFLAGTDVTSPAQDLQVRNGILPTRDSVVLAKTLADKLNKTVGDTLTFSMGGKTYAYPVVGISELAAGDAFYMEWTQVAEIAGFMLQGEPVPTTLHVVLKGDDWTAQTIDEAVDQIEAVLLDAGITSSMINQVAQAEANAQFFVLFGLIFGMTGAVMAAVGAIGLLATLSMSVYERQKEIGVMRSIGARSRTIAGQFLVEGLTVGVIAWVLGAPLSWLFAQGLFAMLPFEGLDIPPYPLTALAVGLVGMVIIAAIASLWPSISASRKTVSEILRYQ